MNPKEFGEKLKKMRKDRNMTLEQLGKLSGFTKSYLSLIENGKQNGVPPIETLRKLSNGLEVDIPTLMRMAGYYEAVDDHEKFLNVTATNILKILTKDDKFLDVIEEDIKEIEEKFNYRFEMDEKLTPQFIRDMVDNVEHWDEEWKNDLLSELNRVARKHGLGGGSSLLKAFQGDFDLDPSSKIKTTPEGLIDTIPMSEEDIKNRFNLSYLLEMDSDLYFDGHLLTDSQKMLIKRLIEAVILHDSESNS